MLHVEDITLKLGRASILNRISLEARPGELCVLMGANGAGKSTLLRAIAGEYQHYQGSILLQQRELRSIPVAEQAKLRAVLSQQLSLQLPFTAAEVVAMGRYVYQVQHTRYDKEIIAYALQLLQVYDLRDRSYLTLSGGQQQRVQMARVLAQLLEAPDLHAVDYTGRKMLLLDEPVTGMDIRHQQLSLQMATELAQQGVLVMTVLHDFQLAAAYAQRVLLLKDGALHTQGTVEQVFTPAHIKDCFGVDVAVLHHPGYPHPLVVNKATGILFQSPAAMAINAY